MEQAQEPYRAARLRITDSQAHPLARGVSTPLAFDEGPTSLLGIDGRHWCHPM